MSQKERKMAVERIRENQTGVENKHLKPYQVLEAFKDYKLYMFFLLGCVCMFPLSVVFNSRTFLCRSRKMVWAHISLGNIPNGGISNFGTIIIQGFGFSTLVTTLMQVSLRTKDPFIYLLEPNTNPFHGNKIPYGFIIAVSILTCVFLNDRFTNKRCVFIVIFLLPNIAGAFGLAFAPLDAQAGRLICYYLTGPYNAAFVLVLSMQTANTAGSYFHSPFGSIPV